MRYMPVVLGAAAALMFATDVTAQDNPDLSGSWTRVEAEGAAAAAAGGGGGGRRGGRGGRGNLGASATLVQTGETLVITRIQGETEVVSTYNLDGSPSSNTTQGRGGEVTQVSTAVWTDGKLVITTTLNFNGNSFDATMTLSLDADGALVVASTGGGRGGRGGGGGGGGGQPTETKYTKG